MSFRFWPLFRGAVAAITFSMPLLWAGLVLAADRSSDVPLDIRRVVIANLSPTMVMPDTAVWQFDSIRAFTSGSRLVCGKVNFQNSGHVYFGPLGFYAVIRSGQVSVSGIQPTNPEQDPTGALEFAYHSVCVAH